MSPKNCLPEVSNGPTLQIDRSRLSNPKLTLYTATPDELYNEGANVNSNYFKLFAGVDKFSSVHLSLMVSRVIWR